MTSDETDDRISFYDGREVEVTLGPARQGFDDLICTVLQEEAIERLRALVASGRILLAPGDRLLEAFDDRPPLAREAWDRANRLDTEPAHPAELVRPGSEAAERVREELLDVPGAPEASDRVAAGPRTAGEPEDEPPC